MFRCDGMWTYEHMEGCGVVRELGDMLQIHVHVLRLYSTLIVTFELFYTIPVLYNLSDTFIVGPVVYFRGYIMYTACALNRFLFHKRCGFNILFATMYMYLNLNGYTQEDCNLRRHMYMYIERHIF